MTTDRANPRVGDLLSHQQARELIGEDSGGGYGIERACEPGYQWQLRRIPLEGVHIQGSDGRLQLHPSEDLVEVIREAPDERGYDYVGLINKFAARRSLPPIAVKPWANLHVLVDGYHRVTAARVVGRKTILALVRVADGSL